MNTMAPRALFSSPLLAALVACSSQSASPANACPRDLPQSCPALAPTYQGDIVPIVAARCAPCHSPQGQESSRDLTSYSSIYPNRGAILDQIYACNMPPSGAEPLTTVERSKLLTWLVCGAPE